MSNPPSNGRPGAGNDPFGHDSRYTNGSHPEHGNSFPAQDRYYDPQMDPYGQQYGQGQPGGEQWPAQADPYGNQGQWAGDGWNGNDAGYDDYGNEFQDGYSPAANQSAIFQASYPEYDADVAWDDEAEGGRGYEPVIESNPNAAPITGYPQDDPRAFVRLTIAYDTTRTDLILPGNLPVTDIMPSLVRRIISINPQRASEGFTLAKIDGSLINPAKSFIEQNIADGEVLTLASRVQQEGKKYDDLVEAIADSVEDTNKPWTEDHSATMAIGTSIIFVLFATLLLSMSRAKAGDVVPIILGLTSALLFGVAWALNRGDRENHAVAIAMTSSIVGFVTGVVATEGAFMELPIVFGGLAASMIAFSAYPLMRSWREILFVPAFSGLALAIVGGLNVALEVSLERLALGTIAVLGILQLLVPLIAWRSSRLEEADALINPEAEPIDPKAARASYISGRRILFSSRIAVTITTLVLIPYMIGAVPWSLVLLGAVALILALSTRRSYAAADVVAGYACALAVFTYTFVLIMRLYPQHWLAGVITLLVFAGLLVAFGLFVKSGRTALRRAADAGEVLAVLALIPAAVLAMELW